MQNVLDEIQPFVDSPTGISNIDENQAKTLIYYAILTWSDVPRIRPIIDINGESGTGKNHLMSSFFYFLEFLAWNIHPVTYCSTLSKGYFKPELAGN